MKLVLAPLAEFTDAPFRLMAKEGGADLTYTEMVSAAALAHGSSPTRHLMEVLPGEGPVACQLFGATEEDLAAATRQVPTDRFVELNLNAGCPMAKVTKCGAGAKLADDPERVFRLIRTMVENTTLPVTLKTRLGPHPERTRVFELLDAAEKAGAKGFILHARYTSQMHGGPVHLDLLTETVARAHIPVTGNGSVVDLKTAQEMAQTGVAAIMIGRAALSNPDIFQRLRQSATTRVDRRRGQRRDVAATGTDPGGNYVDRRWGQRRDDGATGTDPGGKCLGDAPVADAGGIERSLSLFHRHLSYIEKFHAQLVRLYPQDHVPSLDGYVSIRLHTHLFRYFNGLPGAAALRGKMNSIRTRSEMESALRTIFGYCRKVGDGQVRFDA